MSRRMLATGILFLLLSALVGTVGCMSTVPYGAAVVQNQIARHPTDAPLHEDELWVIARSDAMSQDQPGSVAAAETVPGTGALMTRRPGEEAMVAVPLRHTDVRASVAGYIATTEVTQQFQNPYDGKIEAVYVFPLPSNAAVNEFVMTIGERRIRGIIRERAEAERVYAAARSQGFVASLLTQERPNVFTQKVANIEPGKAIDINIKYFHTLSYADGWYEYVFPMVIGPRFNPPGWIDAIGAAGRGAAGASGRAAEVQYLKPTERSGHDISLALHVDAGVRIEQVHSVNHTVDMNRSSDATADVTLAAGESIPNKDFVLRFKVAGDSVKSGLVVQRDEKTGGGYFTLMIYPPDTLRDLPRQPLEMVFTLDVSGSMSGAPIEQSRKAIRSALQNMSPQDTFQVIRFAGSAEQLSDYPLPAVPENIRAGLRYIDRMEAGGGTMMLEGIRRSLQTSEELDRPRVVAFLTDGYIGNEPEILREVYTMRGNTRIFGFGVGASPNRYLLSGMARLGGGCVAYLSLNDDPEQIMADYLTTISHPALTEVNIDWGGLGVEGIYPQRLPDLFVGRPVVLTGRFRGAEPTQVRVTGRVGGETREFVIDVDPTAADVHSGIACVWARGKVADLMDRTMWETNADLPAEIRQVALEYGLMSPYTAFVAVDTLARTAGDHGTTVAVPVPVPDGVRYETTVTE